MDLNETICTQIPPVPIYMYTFSLISKQYLVGEEYGFPRDILAVSLIASIPSSIYFQLSGGGVHIVSV